MSAEPADGAAEEPGDALGSILALIAGRLGAEARSMPGGTDFLRDDVVFARRSGGTLEFRVGSTIAAAAARTADAHQSAGGPDWVALAPTALSRYARDRIDAWFETAWRRAET